MGKAEVGVEIVSVVVDGEVTPRLSRETRATLPFQLPGSQAFTADGRVLTIEPGQARELARLLRGGQSVWISFSSDGGPS